MPPDHVTPPLGGNGGFVQRFSVSFHGSEFRPSVWSFVQMYKTGTVVISHYARDRQVHCSAWNFVSTSRKCFPIASGS